MLGISTVDLLTAFPFQTLLGHFTSTAAYHFSCPSKCATCHTGSIYLDQPRPPSAVASPSRRDLFQGEKRSISPYWSHHDIGGSQNLAPGVCLTTYGVKLWLLLGVGEDGVAQPSWRIPRLEPLLLLDIFGSRHATCERGQSLRGLFCTVPTWAIRQEYIILYSSVYDQSNWYLAEE